MQGFRHHGHDLIKFTKLPIPEFLKKKKLYIYKQKVF
jgi:hypothetical protein